MEVKEHKDDQMTPLERKTGWENMLRPQAMLIW